VRGFAYGQANPLKVPGLNLTGGLVYAGVGGQPRGLYNPDRNNFAPRIGFAYSLSKGTVIRGGYALSYIPVVGSVLSTGFSNDTPWVSSTDGGITVASRFSNPFPSGLLPAIGSSQGLATLVGNAITFIEPADRSPQFHSWNFNVQRELPSRGLIEFGYVGSRGIRLVNTLANEQLNQLSPQYFGLGTQLTQTVPNPFFGTLTGPLGGATIARQQLLRPYPQYTGVARNSPAFGNSVYHSLQVKYEKRMAAGVGGLISYTISKQLNDLSNPQNAFDRQAERAIGDYDVPSRLTLAMNWDLPVGRGKAFMKDIGRAADLIIGGWQISSFATWQAGFGLGFGVQGGTFPIGVGPIRPNVVGNPSEGVGGMLAANRPCAMARSAIWRPGRTPCAAREWTT
jgi:hypothetical protein